MNFALFYHSLVSDWNNGNAHFLRGVVSELLARGHIVRVFEPADGWSLRNLVADYGHSPLDGFRNAYPGLASTLYEPGSLDLKQVLDGVDVAIVHEWTEPYLMEALGRYRRNTHFHLLLHDTHHRLIREASPGLLHNFDGVLAFGESLRSLYLSKGLAKQAWTWHEAADTRVFHPIPDIAPQGDLVWIGNWGDDERAQELDEFLVKPVSALGIKATVFGVRYPRQAQSRLAKAGIDYKGWLPNYRVPEVFAGFRATVHIPRRPYVNALVGIPTIRPFEALACGIPLVCSPWNDAEGLFASGKDFLTAQNSAEMAAHLRRIFNDAKFAAQLSNRGLQTISARHTCAHRVDQLLQILKELNEECNYASC